MILKALFDHRVETGSHLGGKPPNLPRTGDENTRHRCSLSGPSGPVVLLREGRLAKLRKELVEAI
jgi:hypothetical protein